MSCHFKEAMREQAVGVSQRTSPEGGDSSVPTTDGAALAPRLLLTRYLVGEGVELGPGHAPLELPFGGATAIFVDRWEPGENRELFPELGDQAPFPKPGIVADLEVEKLSSLPSESQDFVIASHILEHLADPLGQLAEIHRVLRIGGVALILLPDRRYTFDHLRSATPLRHVIEDHHAGTTEVCDEHVEDFLRNTGGWDERWNLPENREERNRIFDLHRRRSIHVHCWTQDEFLPVVVHTASSMHMRWNLEDVLFVEDVPGGFEFGLVLRRAGPGLRGDVCARRLQQEYEQLWRRSQAGRVEPVSEPAEPLRSSARARRLYEKGRRRLRRKN
jgi:SAM-dependent methyltransferase